MLVSREVDRWKIYKDRGLQQDLSLSHIEGNLGKFYGVQIKCRGPFSPAIII